jgi:hypothetical protein
MNLFSSSVPRSRAFQLFRKVSVFRFKFKGWISYSSRPLAHLGIVNFMKRLSIAVVETEVLADAICAGGIHFVPLEVAARFYH